MLDLHFGIVFVGRDSRVYFAVYDFGAWEVWCATAFERFVTK